MYHGLRESSGPYEKVVETVVRRLKSRRDRGAKVDGSARSLLLPLNNVIMSFMLYVSLSYTVHVHMSEKVVKSR